MDRRTLLAAALAASAAPAAKALAQEAPPRTFTRDELIRGQQAPPPAPSRPAPFDAETQPPVNRDLPSPGADPRYPANRPAETFSRDEIVNSVGDFLGVTAEAAGSAVEKIFSDNGRPTGYIAGEEAAGAFIGGVRYGKGLLYMKNRETLRVFWQGPSVGWDFGGNGSRSFTLCYNLQYPDAIFRRFPGVEGAAYLIGGLGVNYQKADDITLAPMRAGVGLRLGANIGYLSYSRTRHWIPL